VRLFDFLITGSSSSSQKIGIKDPLVPFLGGGKEKSELEDHGIWLFQKPSQNPQFSKNLIFRKNWQKKNYSRNSNISPMQKSNLQKNPLKETKVLQDIITLL
jgi:hypothetical protein